MESFFSEHKKQMSALNKEQKQQIFDYSLGITNQEDNPKIERLIQENPEASDLHLKFKTQFSRLEEWEVESCPDNLVEKTLSKVNQHTSQESYQLGKLIEKEQNRDTVKFSSWGNLGETIAVAAVLIFAAAVFIAPLKYARHIYWKNICESQLSSISNGLNNYRNDYNGQMPSVAAMGGQPWWKIGYQGTENYSNTRNAWLLAKKGYVKPETFVCAAARNGQQIDFDSTEIQKYHDFPGRKYITYSFRIRCSKDNPNLLNGERVLVADMNPVFDDVPRPQSESFRVELDKKLRSANSPNHNEAGQNVLFCDGSVRFTDKRSIGLSDDDIFTLQNIDIYEGNEVPSDVSDAFLAP
jgi:prepilin-type processing-associated H-X9-DG protein